MRWAVHRPPRSLPRLVPTADPARVLPDPLVQQARASHGLITARQLSTYRSGRSRRAGLVVVQPRVLAAPTQPLDAAALVRAVSLSLTPPYAFLGPTALWLHGAGPRPEVVEVGVPADRGITVHPPVRGRRLAPALLETVVVRSGVPLVGLEVAVVQSAAVLRPDVLLRLVEDLVRARRTSPARLLDACGRGVGGSRALRAVIGELADGDLEQHQRRLRRALEAAGVRGLESEVRLVSASGASCWLDLLHRGRRRAVEVDGAWTHGSRAQQVVDRRRDRWVLLEHGIDTTRVAAVEVRDRLPQLVRELLPLLLPAPDAISTG